MKKVIKLLAVAGLWLATAMTAHASTITFVYADPQGTPLAETNTSGTITATFDYAPYGSIALGTAPNGPGYTGHVNDPDIGYVYMQARYYDPAVGRFLSVDPVGSIAGNAFNFSRYAYANNNPIVNVDPDGRESACVDQANHCSGSNENAKSAVKDVGRVVYAVMIPMANLWNSTFHAGSPEGDPIVPVGKIETVTAIGSGIVLNSALTALDDPIGPKAAETFEAPTNPPQNPPTVLPDGHSVRVMPNSTTQYPNGYWRQYDANGNPVDPSTGKQPGSVSRAQSRARTHVELPPKPSDSPTPTPAEKPYLAPEGKD